MNFQEINEPVALFKNQYQEEHKKNTRDLFENLVKSSKININKNRESVALIKELKKALEKVCNTKFWWQFLNVILIISCVVSVVLVACFVIGKNTQDFPFVVSVEVAIISFLAFAFSLCIIMFVLSGKIKDLTKIITQKEAVIAQKISEAFTQMNPLCSLFQEDMVYNLIMKSLPIFKFDKYFSVSRLNELNDHFKLHDCSSINNSMIYCKSGAMNGNPFVLCERKNNYEGLKTYTGTLTISWVASESYVDANGNTRTRMVTKHQTLYANIKKPIPCYNREKFLIYGNEAAPDLNFSRQPSSFADKEGFFAASQLKSAIRKLEKDAQANPKLTAMSNKQFDATFGALDRSNEVQFRLLFTPLAQREMLNILQDNKVGYGDDFYFIKEKMINYVQSEHLIDIDITANPANFYDYDFEEIRKKFNDYSNEFFKSFYFAFAPIFAIPIYQQHRSDIDIYKDVYGKKINFWECETLANSYDESNFRHPQSVTENILKVEIQEGTPSDGRIVNVTAYGFRAEKRVEYVPTFGGDGAVHNVPVVWEEYLPVDKTSTMVINETDGATKEEFYSELSNTEQWRSLFENWGTNASDIKYRNTIVSYLPKR